jgi:hypothetical protein
MYDTVKTHKNGVYIIYEQPKPYIWNTNLYVISKLYVNDYTMHVVLLIVMGHAVNKLYNNNTYSYIHTYLHTYIHTYIRHMSHVALVVMRKSGYRTF